MFAPLVDYPWEALGNYKYFVFVPLVMKLGGSSSVWYFQILVLCLLRFTLYQLWISASRLHLLVKKYQIQQFALSYEQVDREWHSDNYIVFQAVALAIGQAWIRNNNLPIWNGHGFLWAFFFHICATEPLYYCFHRILHSNVFFCAYHSLHHSSKTPEPSTSGLRTFFEEITQTALMAIPILGAGFLGTGSVTLLFGYIIVYDFLKCMGHCNWEIIPASIFEASPFLRYLMYTPSYHFLHHNDVQSNFCLFMPLFDYLGGTLNKRTVSFHCELRRGRKEEVPCFVFLAHCIDILSSLHVSFALRSFSSVPYTVRWHIWFLWPIALIAFFFLWVWGKTFVAYQYLLRGFHAQTWVVPRYGVHYFLPFGLDSINELIEKAILDADAMGVKVVSLAALNKNEALNGGGMLFVNRHKHLRVRLVHGNTLTAAVVLNELPQTVNEVFLTGATSKLGRAIALYLCQRHVRVLMLTSSRDRYEAIASEVSPDQRKYLVHVTKYQAGQHCKTWIVGKWAREKEQKFAPTQTHFHQFVVPPIQELRNDCTYGKLVAMRLPKDAIGMHTCEYVNERDVVAACHAGGLLHALEGWTHHEVGSIDVDRIDHVWQAAIKQGFTPIH